jgi:hypothetical protein
MASLADLFNPTFLMFLGILVLVVAMLVVYFESKMREQNHKIASMLSIVSSVAEELNNVKMTFSMNGGTINSNNSPNIIELNSSVNNNFETIKRMDLDIPLNLIEVSDDESDDESDNESDNESDDSDEEENLDLDEDAEDLDEDEDDDVEDLDLGDDAEDLDLDEDDQDFDLDTNVEEFDLDADAKDEIKVLKLDNEIEPEEIDISNIDLKSIKFDTSLEEKKEPDISEYKKLPINKLKSIAIEKGLIDESSKLKKPEILKLLGVHIHF